MDKQHEEVSFKCNACKEWSRFTPQLLQHKLPSSWEETEAGYFCGCTNRPKTKTRINKTKD